MERIPNELLTCIFQSVCNEPVKLQKVYQSEEAPAPPALQLSAVCSHWRSVLQLAPSLWTQITVSFDKNSSMPLLDIVKFFLERSNEMLLTLNISFYSIPLHNMIDDPAFKAIASQAHRWGTLSIKSDKPVALWILRPPILSSCPELQTLELSEFRAFGVWTRIDDFDFVPMPKLTSFYGTFFDPLHPTHTLPWHQLTQLTLNWYHKIPRFAEQCINLLALTVRGNPYYSDGYDFHVPMSTGHRTMQHLRLSFENMNGSTEPEPDRVNHLLESFSFPHLTKLEIINDCIDAIPVICTSGMLNTIINQYSRSLRHLAFHSISISDTDLIAFLRNMPFLTSIAIEDPEWWYDCPMSITFIESLCVPQSKDSSNSTLLPNLRSLSFAIRQEFDETSFVEMICSRWNKGDDFIVSDEVVASLNRVQVHLHLSSMILTMVDLTKLEPLKVVQEEGLVLDISIVTTGEDIRFDRVY